MRYLFFLIIFLIPIGLANAETGKNYDTITNPDGSITWSSHYERIFGNDSQWHNYLLINDANELSVSSASIDFTFDKTSCSFRLDTPFTDDFAIPNFYSDLLIDAVPIPNLLCNVTGLNVGEDVVSFTVEKTGYKTLYEVSATGIMEWTYESDLNLGLAKTYTIIENCNGCKVESENGNRIRFQTYELDTKNDVHNSVIDAKPFPCTAPKDLFCPSEAVDYKITYQQIINTNEKVLIDPTFSSNNPTVDGQMGDNGNNDVCDGDVLAKDTSSTAMLVGPGTTANAVDCWRVFAEYDITSIASGYIITDVDFIFDNQGNGGLGPTACDYIGMETRPSTASNAAIWASIGTDTVLNNTDTTCQTVGNNRSVDLGSAGITYIENSKSRDWVAIGMKADSETLDLNDRYASIATEEDGTATPKPTLTITYTPFSIDAVDDLTSTSIRGTAVDLSWGTPATNGTISGYQINMTTPWNSNVATQIKETTGAGTTYTVTGLTGETQYSFRVSGIAGGFKNATGNVLNITTAFDPTGSFTPGTFNLTGSGTDVREIKYLRTDIDDTTLTLDITADNDFELACNFHYKFANTNKTYTNIANVSINAEEDMATFQFNNVTNEIIDVLCWDQYTNQSARYVITITDFPLLQQIAAFKAGDFGTTGMFGALDFISLIVVIFAMVGFNRVNETVGVVLGLFLVGGLAVLSNGLIISWATTFTAGFAVVIMWAIATTRKD